MFLSVSGVSTHTMSRIYKGQKKGRSGEEESLVWEDWDYSGLIKVSLLKPNYKYYRGNI